MKGFIATATIASLVLGMNCAYALDMKPGEWKMENTHIHIVDDVSGTVLMDQKNVDTSMQLCYTEKMSEDAKKMKKGDTTGSGGCNITFVENNDTRQISETICNQDGTKTNSLVETTKVSDTEFAMKMKMSIDSAERKMTTTQTIKQTYVGKTCTESTRAEMEARADVK